MPKKHFFSQYSAEFIGTFFLVFFGCGAAILMETSPDAIPRFVIPIVFGGTVSIMIYAVGHISGAHFNPAVTLAFWVLKKFPTHRLGGYVVSQFAGGLLASCLHALVWGRQHSFGETLLSVDIGIGFLVEIILSFALMFVITAVATDSRAVGELAGMAIGTTVCLCAFVGGPLTGASMNPARSLAPALLTGHLEGLWLYFLSSGIGTVMGAMAYKKMRCDAEASEQKHGCC